MADDVTLPGSGAVIASDDIGSGRQAQLVKPVYGDDGSATMVSATNPLPTAPPTYRTLTGSATSVAVVIASFEVTGFSSIILAASGTFSGTVVLQGSLDGTTWTSVNFNVLSSNGNQAASGDYTGSASISTGNHYVAALWFRYYRVNCTGYASGTLNVTVGLNNAPLHALRVSVSNSSLSVSATPNTTTAPADGDTGTAWTGARAYGLAFNGSTFDRFRLPRIFKSVTATASGDTAVWTPTSGKRFQLLRFQVFATSDAAQTTGGVITVKFRDATTDTGIAVPVYVPATGGTALGGWSSGWIDIGPYGYRSAAINQALNVNLSAALTAGSVGVLATGTEE